MVMAPMITGAGAAQTLPLVPAADQACDLAVAAAERSNGIPARLLATISRVESGRRDRVTNMVAPWPWTVNAEGQGTFYDSKAQAIAAVQAMQARGIRSIDVGCAQISLLHHPAAFSNLEQAFDPPTNAAYAARFLKELFGLTGDWSKAAAMYHSATPELASEYERKVLAVWPMEQRPTGSVGATALARAWAATLTSPAPGFVRIPRPSASERTGQTRLALLPRRSSG
jgi:hypothetical protein